MKYSIVIPIYKVQMYLDRCIESVLNQTFTDIEVILVDDGSPDICGEMCDKYRARDERVTVIHKENGGLSSARNAGIVITKGEYIIFLDSDDFYYDHMFLEKLNVSIDKENVDLLMFQRRLLDDKSGKMASIPKPYSKKEMDTFRADELFLLLSKEDKLDASASMKVIRRQLFFENDIYFKEGLLSEDIEWFFRLASIVKTARITNDVGYCYRVRKGSISHTKSSKHAMDMVCIVTSAAKRITGTQMSVAMNDALLNYLAYQYYIAMGLAWICTGGEERARLMGQLYDIDWVTETSFSLKTRLALIIWKLFRGTAASIFGRYVQLKR